MKKRKKLLFLCFGVTFIISLWIIVFLIKGLEFNYTVTISTNRTGITISDLTPPILKSENLDKVRFLKEERIDYVLRQIEVNNYEDAIKFFTIHFNVNLRIEFTTANDSVYYRLSFSQGKLKDYWQQN